MSEALVVRDLTITLGGREILKNVGFSLQGGALAALAVPTAAARARCWPRWRACILRRRARC